MQTIPRIRKSNGRGRGLGLQPPVPITSFPVGNLAGQQPNVMVVDVTNGRSYTLFKRNETAAFLYGGSIAKLITAYSMYKYFVGRGEWATRQITVTADDVNPTPYPGINPSMAGLQANDIATPFQLMQCALIPSGADGCQALLRTYDQDQGGTGDRAKAITLLNSDTAALGCSGTTNWVDGFGGSAGAGGTPVRNVMTAADMAKILVAAIYNNPTLQGIAQTATATLTLGLVGGGTRNLTINHADVAFVNGPIEHPAGYKDSRFIGGKIGDWIIAGDSQNFSQCALWTSGAAILAVITLGSPGGTSYPANYWGRTFDQTGMIALAQQRFPYIHGATPSDPLIAQVKFIIGGDGTIADDSGHGHTVTAIGAVANGNPIVGGSTHSISFTANTQQVGVSNAVDLSLTTQNWTREMWFAGNGSEPSFGTEYAFYIVIDGGGGSRQYALHYNSGNVGNFITANAGGWDAFQDNPLDQNARPVWFNGAPRHIALQRNGSNYCIYLSGQRMGTPITFAGSIPDSTAVKAIGCNPFSISLIGTVAEDRMTIGSTSRYGSAGVIGVDCIKFSRN